MVESKINKNKPNHTHTAIKTNTESKVNANLREGKGREGNFHT
jgi:hypothetical protein